MYYVPILLELIIKTYKIQKITTPAKEGNRSQLTSHDFCPLRVKLLLTSPNFDLVRTTPSYHNVSSYLTYI